MWAIHVTSSLIFAVAQMLVHLEVEGVGQAGSQRATCPAAEFAPMQHIRPQDATLARTLLEGIRRSETLRRVVADIEQRDGMIYVARRLRVRANGRVLSGGTSLDVVQAGGYRVVTVLITPQSLRRTIATLGHELQHVDELLRDPAAVDREAVEALYKRIGYAASAGVYETAGAQHTERQIVRELARCRGLRD
jgi:hypothetical protein